AAYTADCLCVTRRLRCGRCSPRPLPIESALPHRPRAALPVTVPVTVLLCLVAAYATDHLRITE
ncbi:MAG: hypothetical protein NZM11_12700, partial [Anaerolineales bacterium]|nr:hypothetical protein [Anaerolineales bacterium]